MARIAVGAFRHETNCFVPARTDYAYFVSHRDRAPLLRGDEFIEVLEKSTFGIAGFLKEMGDAHEIVPLLWADGGAGTQEVARHVAELADSGGSQFRPLYDDHLPLWEKVRTVARSIYGAEDIIADKKVRDQFSDFEECYSHFPVCMAKTQYSFSTDPNLLGAPTGHVVPIRELRLSAGAEFVVAICGEIMTMPGLPKSARGQQHLCQRGWRDSGSLLRASAASLSVTVAANPGQKRFCPDRHLVSIPQTPGHAERLFALVCPGAQDLVNRQPDEANTQAEGQAGTGCVFVRQRFP